MSSILDRRAETTVGHLNRYLRFSAVDGPGNRFVVFLQGCNFDCINCHNPYTIADCNSCGLCVDPCERDALTITEEPRVVVDRSRCDECGTCVDVCPYSSTPLSRMITVDELVAEVRRTAPFLSGVTVSGGEPTLQARFVAAFFEAIKADPELSRLTTFVDTNGSAPLGVWDRLIPVTDGFMVDLKALDAATHVRLTARSNGPVLRSIPRLAAAGRLHEVRLLVVPGYTDHPETTARTGRWLAEHAPGVPVRLIGFRRHGVRPAFAHLAEPARERLEALAGLLRDADIDVLVV